jgi:hypothetical protein
VCLVDRGNEGKEGGLERRGYICEWSLLAVRALAELKLALCFFFKRFFSQNRINHCKVIAPSLIRRLSFCPIFLVRISNMDVFFSIPFGHVLDVAAAAMGIIFSQYCFFRLILFFFGYFCSIQGGTKGKQFHGKSMRYVEKPYKDACLNCQATSCVVQCMFKGLQHLCTE